MEKTGFNTTITGQEWPLQLTAPPLLLVVLYVKCMSMLICQNVNVLNRYELAFAVFSFGRLSGYARCRGELVRESVRLLRFRERDCTRRPEPLRQVTELLLTLLILLKLSVTCAVIILIATGHPCYTCVTKKQGNKREAG